MVGCTALVGIIASVVAVGSQQIMRSAPLVLESNYRQPETAVKPPVPETEARKPSEPAQFEVARAGAQADMMRPHQPSEEATKLINATGAAVPRAVPLASGIEDMEAKRDKISRTVETFFAAPNVEAKLPFVRDPDRVKPLMQDYYSREPMGPVKWRGLGRLVRVDEPGYRFGYVQAQFDGVPPLTLIIEEMKDGAFRVDWECLVRYGEMSWSDFLQRRPTEAKLMRVKASRAAPAASSTQPGTEWLELRHSEQPGTVRAFFRRDEPKLMSLLEQLNQGGWKDVPLTLRMAFLPATDDLVLITGVEGKGWLILGKAGL